jgi:hypothetical protein
MALMMIKWIIHHFYYINDKMQLQGNVCITRIPSLIDKFITMYVLTRIPSLNHPQASKINHSESSTGEQFESINGERGIGEREGGTGEREGGTGEREGSHRRRR